MTQKEKVENYIGVVGHITAYDAFKKFNIVDLASIIRSLKNDGIVIYDKYCVNKKTGAQFKVYGFKKRIIDKYKGGVWCE